MSKCWSCARCMFNVKSRNEAIHKGKRIFTRSANNQLRETLTCAFTLFFTSGTENVSYNDVWTVWHLSREALHRKRCFNCQIMHSLKHLNNSKLFQRNETYSIKSPSHTDARIIVVDSALLDVFRKPKALLASLPIINERQLCTSLTCLALPSLAGDTFHQ